MKHPLAFALLLCVPITAAGQWYAWRDGDGSLHVTDQFATIPDASRSAARALGYGGHQPSRAPHDTAVAPPADLEHDPVQAEIARHEARLASRLAHVNLLRATPGEHSAQQLRLENLLENEIAEEQGAIAALRRTPRSEVRP